jgi:hypothetical protein
MQSALSTWQKTYAASFAYQKKELNDYKDDKIDYEQLLGQFQSLTTSQTRVGQAFHELQSELQTLQDLSFKSKHVHFL